MQCIYGAVETGAKSLTMTAKLCGLRISLKAR